MRGTTTNTDVLTNIECDNVSVQDLQLDDSWNDSWDSLDVTAKTASSESPYLTGVTSEESSSGDEVIQSLPGTGKPSSKRKASKSHVHNDSDSLLLQRQKAPYHQHLPRIPKRDVRRQYPTMFTNVYNTCDYNFTAQYLSTFCRDDFVMVLKRIPFTRMQYQEEYFKHNLALHQLNTHLPDTQVFESHGIKANADFWFGHMMEVPDMVFRRGATQIRLRTDDSGVVIFKYTIQGTKLVSPDEPCAHKFKPPEDLFHNHKDRIEEYHEHDEDFIDAVYINGVDNAALEKSKAGAGGSDTAKPLPFDEALRRYICPISEATSAEPSITDGTIKVTNGGKVLVEYHLEGTIAMHFDSSSRVYLLDYHMVIW